MNVLTPAALGGADVQHAAAAIEPGRWAPASRMSARWPGCRS
jgi:hypothetical protein